MSQDLMAFAIRNMATRDSRSLLLHSSVKGSGKRQRRAIVDGVYNSNPLFKIDGGQQVFRMADGQLFRLDIITEWDSPLAPLDASLEGETRENPSWRMVSPRRLSNYPSTDYS